MFFENKFAGKTYTWILETLETKTKATPEDK